MICFEWLQRPENVVAGFLTCPTIVARFGHTPYASSTTRTRHWRHAHLLVQKELDQQNADGAASPRGEIQQTPQCRKPGSDRKDGLRASLNAAKRSTAFCGWRSRTRRQRQRSKVCSSQTAFTRSIRILISWAALNTRRVFHRPSTKTKPAQNFQMRDKLEFPNAMEIPDPARPFFLTKSV